VAVRSRSRGRDKTGARRTDTQANLRGARGAELPVCLVAAQRLDTAAIRTYPRNDVPSHWHWSCEKGVHVSGARDKEREETREEKSRAKRRRWKRRREKKRDEKRREEQRQEDGREEERRRETRREENKKETRGLEKSDRNSQARCAGAKDSYSGAASGGDGDCD
jgi:hypothetical protein